MPNWCFNNVIVSAKTEAELNEFLDFCDQPHTSRYRDFMKDNEVVVNENAKGVFWNFITPTDLEAYFGSDTFGGVNNDNADVMSSLMQEMNEGLGWYAFNNREWGTKWDIELERDYISIAHNEKNNTYYFNWSFDTAWSPAENAYHAMAKRFPNLEFDFEITEEANFYAGKMYFKNGRLHSESVVSDPTHADFMALDIPCTHCVWGMEELDLSSDSLEALEEMSDYFFDDCPAVQQVKARIAELTIDNPSEDVLELSVSNTTQTGE